MISLIRVRLKVLYNTRQTDESKFFLNISIVWQLVMLSGRLFQTLGPRQLNEELSACVISVVFIGNFFLGVDLKVPLCVRSNRSIKYFGAASVLHLKTDMAIL